MKIRIEGTMDELESAIQKLREVFCVTGISRLYKNRSGDLYRIYVDVDGDKKS